MQIANVEFQHPASTMQQSVTQPLSSFYKDVNLEWIIPNGLKILCEPLPPTHKYKIYDSPLFTTTDPIIKWRLFFSSQTYDEEGSHPLEPNEKDKSPQANFDNLENWYGNELQNANPLTRGVVTGQGVKKQFVFASIEIEKMNDAQMDVYVEELNVCCGIHKTLGEPEIICEVAKGGMSRRWIQMRSKNPVGSYCKFAKHSPLLDSPDPSRVYPTHANCDIVYRFKGKLYTGN